MDEITNPKQLAAWLKERPREDAVLIAVRCTMRVFPLLAPLLDQEADSRRASIIQPICRAMVVASVPGTWPMRATKILANTNAARAAVRSATWAARAATATAARDAANAAAAAADAAAATTTATADTNAARAATWAARAAIAYADVFWKAVSDDAHPIGRGWPHERFNETPLWHAGTPSWIRDPWHNLRSNLLAEDEGWEVWTEWYENRLDGKPANEELEVAKALIPNEIWDAGPATLNAEIARLIAEQAEAPEEDVELPEAIHSIQSSAGERFEGSDDVLIDVADDPLSREIRTDEIAQEFHAEVLDAAEQVLGSCRASNQLGRLAEVVDGYLKRIGASPEDVRPTMVARGERLRFLRDADLRLQNEEDPIPGPMAPDAFARLQDLIAAHNQYVATDPKLKEIQDALADPEAQVRATVTPDASQEAIEEIKPVLTDAAVEVLSSATEAAQSNTEAGKRSTVWLSETWRNLSVEMFRRALFQLRQSARALADHVELSAKLTVAEAMEATQAAAEIAWRNSKRGALGMGIIEVTPSVAEAMGSLTQGMDLGGRMFRAAEVVAGTALVPIGGAVGVVVVALLVRLLSRTEWFRHLLDDEQVRKLLPFLKA